MIAARPNENLYKAAADFLRRYPPFDRIEAEPLAFVTSRLTLAYYAKETLILSPATGEPVFFHIIQRGLVCQTDPQTGQTVTLRAGESFPTDALLERRAVLSTYTAAEDTFC